MSLVTAYNPLPISFTRGQGIWLYDKSGKAYLDASSGIAVCGLGHAHPEIAQTISEYAGRLLHVSNGYHIEEQEQLAARMVQLTGMNQAFFANSGAEANEAAIKLTRLWGHQKNIKNPTIIVMEHAFHGRTMATLTATGSIKAQTGYDPLVPGFIRVPFHDLKALEHLGAHHHNIVAIMLETIQGEGGVHVASSDYLHGVAKLCALHDWMLIIDEVQTGNGRTGALYSCMHHHIVPDVLTTAKGLGNGIPISACLMSQRAKDLFKPGNHGSTFGGNPLACATALNVLKIIERDNLCEKVQKNGVILKNLLQQHLSNNPHVKDIRGKGYMLGIELDQSAHHVRKIGLKHGILFNITAETVVRLLPPLIITEDEIRQLVDRLTATLTEAT